MIPLNVVIPFGLVTDGGPDSEWFALGHWLLPAVPRVGEEVVALDRRMRVEQVRWSERGVSIYLPHIRIKDEHLSFIEGHGWETAPWVDEPPSDWLPDNEQA